MKKILVLIICVSLLIPSFVSATDLALNAKSAILIDVDTGKILFEKNKDERLKVASLTKMMSQLLILEAKEKGLFDWNEKVKVSANAAGYGGSQIYLSPGEEMKIEDLMKGISMASANDATVALAERIAGSEEKFVSMMNNKVKELGLKNTNFKNPTGLDEEDNYSSSYDLSVIARELLRHKEILRFSSLYEDYLREDTKNKFWLVNTNKLVRLYEGCDGLKTGYTDDALYTMAVTAKRGSMRLLTIVLGEKESKVRNKEVVELLDYGFNTYKSKIIRKENEIVETKKIEKANKLLEITLKENATVLENKNDNKEYKERINNNNIKLPKKKNQIVCSLDIYDGSKLIKTYDLVSRDDVNKIINFKVIINSLKSIFLGKLDI